MLITTTSTIEGKTIKEYRGVVFGEVINGVDFMKDYSASITNYTGGRDSSLERELVNTRADAINEMMQRAEKIGANAIIGLKVDYEPLLLSEGSPMLTITVSGTAVVIE